MPVETERTEGQTEATEASQVATQEQSPESDNDWMNAVIRGGGADLSDDGGEAVGESEQETTESTQQGSTAQETETSQPQLLSREEVNKLIAQEVAKANADLDRKVQSEVDRRDALRRKRELDEKRKKLRETDPLGFIELDKQLEEEANQQLTEVEKEQERTMLVNTVMQNSGSLYDRHVLDPFVQGLPQSVAQQVFKEVDPDGLEGRSKLVKRALELLPAHYEKVAEEKAMEKLRKNQAFRKEILLEIRGEEEDPEIIQGTVATTPTSFDMNSTIRRASGRYIPSRR